MDGREPSESDHQPLAFIFEGMKVYDREGEEIGTVEHIFFGNTTPQGTRNAESDRPDEPDMAREGLWDSIEEVIDPVDHLEEDLRASLGKSGFIRVSGLKIIGEKRYIPPDRIGEVSDGKIYLNVPVDELVRG
jgi:hypothetical protein